MNLKAEVVNGVVRISEVNIIPCNAWVISQKYFGEILPWLQNWEIVYTEKEKRHES